MNGKIIYLVGREDKDNDPIDPNDPLNDKPEPDPAEVEKQEQMEAETARCYDNEQKSLDMQKMKVTNRIQNSHVFLPKAVNPRRS